MSGSDSTIAIKIDVNDLASKQIDGLQKQIAKLQTPAERASKGMRGLTDTGRVEKLSTGMRNVARESSMAFQNIGRIVGPLGIITSAASIAGLGALSREWAKMGNALGNSAQRAGVSVDRLSAIQVAAQMTGASAQSATAGMTSLNDAITNAAAGRDANAIMTFQKLGVNVRDMNGHLRSAADIMPEVAHGLASIKNPTLQHDYANMLFGGAGDELLPLLRRYDEMMQKAQKTGAGMTPKMVADAQQANEAWQRFGLDFTGITNRIEDDWSGTVTHVLTSTSDWIEHNQALADSYTKVGAGIMALGALKPAAWVMRMLGLGALTQPEIVVPAAAAAAAGVATYKNGQDSATAQGIAEQQGYTRVASVDGESGMPTAFTNPKTGDTKSAMAFDPRYNPSLRAEPATAPSPAPLPGILPPSPSGEAPPDLTKNLFGKVANSQLGKLLARGESGAADYNAVNRGAAGGYASGMENLVNMTVAQVQAAQKAHKFNAAGRYQVIGPTLDSAVSTLGLTGNEKFDQATQDRIFEQYLIGSKRKAIANYIDGQSNDLGAALRGMSREWASVADPDTGMSHYGGVGHNKASISVEEASEALNEARRSIAVGAPANIQGGTGAPPGAASDPKVKGAADLKITLNGFPTGTSTIATTDGNVFGGPPRIVQAMPLGMQP